MFVYADRSIFFLLDMLNGYFHVCHIQNLSQLIKFWTLLHMLAVMAKMSLHTSACSSEPSLLARTDEGHKLRLRPQVTHIALQSNKVYL